MALLKIKVGRHEYEITEADKFMDNGYCVQLLTQSKEPSTWGERKLPVLSKRAILAIGNFVHNPIKHGYGHTVKVFSLSSNI
jgi:hypothetical protein